jgi:uncharacterized protein (DUF302 family)
MGREAGADTAYDRFGGETLMLQAGTAHKLDAIEAALRRAANRNGASVVTNIRVGQHLTECGSPDDAIVFGICHPEVYAGLLAADIRISAFLPCRIAAYSQAGRVTLLAATPLDACRALNRPDLAPLAAPLEDLLKRIIEQAAAVPEATAETVAAVHTGSIGATEEQVSMRGSLPQRIDCRGTKVEDMAGTGQHDSQGG